MLPNYLRRHNRLLSLALEAVSEKMQPENERTFYGRLSDAAFQELKKRAAENGSVQYQEQYTITQPNGSIRVRMTLDDNEQSVADYIMTAKGWTPGVEGRMEKEEHVSRDMFLLFRRLCPSGMVKTRYTVNVGNDHWEYDIFYDENGNRREWCKLDLENSNADSLSMPIPLDELIEDQAHSRPPELQTKISALYRDYFTVIPKKSMPE